MALSTQEFAALLGRSHPEALNRAQEIKDSGEQLYFRSPNLYPEPLDRQAAAIGNLLEGWDRLDEPLKNEAVRLAEQDSPLADIYNFVDYRQNQTVIMNPTTGTEFRYPPGSEDWTPYIEPPTTGAQAIHDATSRIAQMVDAASHRLDRETRIAQAPPATGQVVTTQGAAEHTGSRVGQQQQPYRGR